MSSEDVAAIVTLPDVVIDPDFPTEATVVLLITSTSTPAPTPAVPPMAS